MDPILEYNGFTLPTIVKLVATVVLLLMSGMMSSSEVAFFSLSHNDIRDIKHRK